MTVTELKRRLTPGTRIRLVRSLLGKCDSLRTVTEITATYFIVTPDGTTKASYCRWPKSQELQETPKGFLIYETDYSGILEIAAEYEWERFDEVE